MGAIKRNKVCKDSLKAADLKQRVCSGRSSDWKFLVPSPAVAQRTDMRVPFNLTDNLHEIVRGPVVEIKITGVIKPS